MAPPGRSHAPPSEWRASRMRPLSSRSAIETDGTWSSSSPPTISRRRCTYSATVLTYHAAQRIRGKWQPRTSDSVRAVNPSVRCSRLVLSDMRLGGLVHRTAFIATSDLPLRCERRSRSFHIAREAKPFVRLQRLVASVAGQTWSVSKKNQRWPSKSSARYRRPGGPSSTAERIVAPAVFARSKCRSRLFT